MKMVTLENGSEVSDIELEKVTLSLKRVYLLNDRIITIFPDDSSGRWIDGEQALLDLYYICRGKEPYYDARLEGRLEALKRYTLLEQDGSVTTTVRDIVFSKLVYFRDPWKQDYVRFASTVVNKDITREMKLTPKF